MKLKKFFSILCLVLIILIFSGCSDSYTFNYDSLEISSVTIIKVHGGENEESEVGKENWDNLIEDLNGLNYKSYDGETKGLSVYQIVIKFADGNEEIIDSYRIRRTGNKPLKYQCSDSEYKKIIEKYN